MLGKAGAVDPTDARPRPDVVRRWGPVVALAVAVVAAVTDPAGWAPLIGLGVAVVVFVVWGWWWPGLPVPVVAVLVLAAVVVTQLSGRLEPGLFLAALLAVMVARRADSPWEAGVVCLAAAACPVVIVVVQPAGNRIAWGIWVVGIAFSALVGAGMRRQERLVVELAAARAQLAAQAHAEERRRIARDVHDLVGHGLSAVLLHVAGARHVLHRDIDVADEALAAAELAGRRSMRELRGTVTVLRGADGGDAVVPLPDLAQLAALVDAARHDGLPVQYRSAGDPGEVGAAVGLTLYRIAQEALHNAARHAPRASTLVTLRVTVDSVELAVESVGPLTAPRDDDRPRYGLVGMRERAASVGGELQAGPTSQGWAVCCRVPAGPA